LGGWIAPTMNGKSWTGASREPGGPILVDQNATALKATVTALRCRK
jgi:hypothetical protein